MGRRTLLLIAAFLVAALGTAGVYLYVNGVDQRAKADNSVAQVLVATRDIPAGLPAEEADQYLALRDYLKSSVADGGYRGNLDGLENQVTLVPIAAGQPIFSSQFGAPGTKTTLTIPAGSLAVSVVLDVGPRVAAFLAADSKVTVFVNTDTKGGSGVDQTRVLIPSVTVLAVGRSTVVPNSEAAAGSATEVASDLITLAVNQKEALQIMFAQEHGKLSFGLLGATPVDATVDGVTAESLFD